MSTEYCAGSDVSLFKTFKTDAWYVVISKTSDAVWSPVWFRMWVELYFTPSSGLLFYIQKSLWAEKLSAYFLHLSVPGCPVSVIHSLGKEKFIRKRNRIQRHHLEYSVSTFVHVVLLRLGWKWELSPRNNQKMLQISPHSHATNSFRRSQSSSSSSGLLISPGLFAYNRHLIYTQSPVSEWVCSVFVLSSGLGVKACIFQRICTSIWAIFWVVKEEGRARPCPMVTYFINVYYASRDFPHWIWPNMHRIPPHALFCSGKDEMLQYLSNGLMVPVGLSVFWIATKHWSQCKVSNKRDCFCSGHLFKWAVTFLHKEEGVLFRPSLPPTHSMFGWKKHAEQPTDNSSWILSHCLIRVLHWNTCWWVSVHKSPLCVLHKLRPTESKKEGLPVQKRCPLLHSKQTRGLFFISVCSSAAATPWCTRRLNLFYKFPETWVGIF